MKTKFFNPFGYEIPFNIKTQFKQRLNFDNGNFLYSSLDPSDWNTIELIHMEIIDDKPVGLFRCENFLGSTDGTVPPDYDAVAIMRGYVGCEFPRTIHESNAQC